jgi:hypothetical protein
MGRNEGEGIHNEENMERKEKKETYSVSWA